MIRLIMDQAPQESLPISREQHLIAIQNYLYAIATGDETSALGQAVNEQGRSENLDRHFIRGTVTGIVMRGPIDFGDNYGNHIGLSDYILNNEEMTRAMIQQLVNSVIERKQLNPEQVVTFQEGVNTMLGHTFSPSPTAPTE